jgi:hypothetical protein
MRRVASSLSYANVMATVAVFVALGGGALAATGGLRSKQGVIHGCVSKRSHVLTVVRAGRKCGLAATSLRFDARGVRGVAGVAGAPGTPGARGAPGAKGSAGAKGSPGKDGQNGVDGIDGKNAIALFAQVLANGTIRDSSPGVGISKPVHGEYLVTFPQDVSDCAPAATIGLTSGNTYVPGFVAANAAGFDEVSVTTFPTNSTTPADNAFDLIVSCPSS